MLQQELNVNLFGQRFHDLRKSQSGVPDIAVSIPVNAKADLSNVLQLLKDLTRYNGPYSLEVILVINNFPPAEPPAYIPRFEEQGICVTAIPSVKKPGMAIPITARMHGVAVASCDPVVSFDADCRIPHPTELINWYVERFKAGAALAYTYVGHYDIHPGFSVMARLAIHHLSRWVKRVAFGVPVTRGSNFAVRKSFVIPLYNEGYMADDINVGPVVKQKRGKIYYSGAKKLRVLTSGRYVRENWPQLVRYLWYRMRYNLRVLPVSKDAATRTKRR